MYYYSEPHNALYLSTFFQFLVYQKLEKSRKSTLILVNYPCKKCGVYTVNAFCLRTLTFIYRDTHMHYVSIRMVIYYV